MPKDSPSMSDYLILFREKNGKREAGCGINLAEICATCLCRAEQVVPGLPCNPWKLTAICRGKLPLPKISVVGQKFCSLSASY